jgi:hypothetical protein
MGTPTFARKARPRQRKVVCLLISVVTFALGACSTEHYVRAEADVSRSSLVTDAKQRVILSLPRVHGTSSRIVCAEPSPDVAQAISEALKVGLSVDLSKVAGADSKDKSVGFDFGKSSAASVAQLGERLAVVQMLRDRMYRACEAYANGAIGEAAYTLLMARNDKTMMSLLSNELAAGAFGRALASIGGSASATGVSEADLGAQQKAVKAASDALVKTALAESPKKEDIENAAKKLEDEVAKLAALERRVITATATASPGSLASAPTGRSGDVQTMAEIHRHYLDDDGIDPLIDACIIGVERLKSDSPTAQAYVQSIAKRAEGARDAASRISNDISEQRSKLALTQERSSIDRQRLAEAEAREKARLPIAADETPAALREQLALSETRITTIKQLLESLTDERALLLATPGIEPKDLYMASQSPFAAFCFQSVLAGDSKFMNLRMQQKRQLRGIDFDKDALVAKQLDMCLAVTKADKVSMDEKARTALLTECAELMRRQAPKSDDAKKATGPG